MKRTFFALLATLALTSTLAATSAQAQNAGCFTTTIWGDPVAEGRLCYDGKSINPLTKGGAPKPSAVVTPPVVTPIDPVEPVDPIDPVDPVDPEVPTTPVITDPEDGGPTPTEGTYVFEVPAIVNLDATAGITQVAPGAYIVSGAVVDANASALLGIPAGTYSGTVFNGKATIRLDVIPL